ncbi:MAG: hypothetical protein ACE37F_24060 [Nannocystaceae bacterium]|nr:hypothetical protein [bacterium]
MDSVQDAARLALRTSRPLGVWRETERGRHEIFFYRDLVIHASAAGLLGVAAVRRMLDEHRQAFTIAEGRWPSRHTMLMDWSKVLDAATATRPLRQSTLPPVRYSDESEATAPLHPRSRSAAR